MAEWHIDPVQISETWTEELLMLMLDKFEDRCQRQRESYESIRNGDSGPVKPKVDHSPPKLGPNDVDDGVCGRGNPKFKDKKWVSLDEMMSSIQGSGGDIQKC